jgi:hypothetical protein
VGIFSYFMSFTFINHLTLFREFLLFLPCNC